MESAGISSESNEWKYFQVVLILLENIGKLPKKMFWQMVIFDYYNKIFDYFLKNLLV